MNSQGSTCWQKKMGTWFKILDADGDGTITMEDQVLIAKRFQENKELERDQAVKLEKHLAEWWEEVMKDVKGYTHDDFVKRYHGVISDASTKEGSKRRLEIMLGTMFKTVDTDCDGTISPREYNYFIQSLNQDMASRAKEAFESIDTNHDGELSLDEFVEAGIDFFFNENDTVFKNFFGPLE